jgi:predicted nucleotidyltransferase
MELERDFKELLELLNSHKVEYLLVGAYALAFHGAPRFTGDLDIFVRSSHENAERIMAALSAFGFGSEGLSPEDFEKPNQIIQLGVPPVRVDLITSISGVTWEQAMGGSIASDMDGTTVRFIGKNELVMNKRAAGRKKDLADIEALGE